MATSRREVYEEEPEKVLEYIDFQEDNIKKLKEQYLHPYFKEE